MLQIYFLTAEFIISYDTLTVWRSLKNSLFIVASHFSLENNDLFF